MNQLAPAHNGTRRAASVPQVTIDGNSALWRVLETLLVEPFLRGELPVRRCAHAQRLPVGTDVVAPGGIITHVNDAYGHRDLLAEGLGWRARYSCSPDRSVALDVVAVDLATADEVVAALHALSAPPEADPRRLELHFVRLGSCGADTTARTIDVPIWSEVTDNYPAAVQPELDRLAHQSRPRLDDGRLLLLHGPPGTGKTTFLRALASAWRGWCDTTVVVDPDQLFTKAPYLFEVVMDCAPSSDAGEDGDTGADGNNADGPDAAQTRRWTLFILEDCDELLRADAKQSAGQALSRLLNLADGILGQGIPVLFCLTTNEPLDRIHPAITRPGRCLANLEIGAFEPDEAARWLAAHNVTTTAPLAGPMTLAELCARR